MQHRPMFRLDYLKTIRSCSRGNLRRKSFITDSWLDTQSVRHKIINNKYTLNIHCKYTLNDVPRTRTTSLLLSVSVLELLILVVLLLARYVPNVAKRSIWDQCKNKYILRTDRRPTGDRPFIWENFKWPLSPRGVRFMFGSMWDSRGRRIEWR